MKRKDIQEIKMKPVAELKKMLEDLKIRLRDLKFNLAAGKVKNVQELRDCRKSIARIMTFINEENAKHEKGSN